MPYRERWDITGRRKATEMYTLVHVFIKIPCCYFFFSSFTAFHDFEILYKFFIPLFLSSRDMRLYALQIKQYKILLSPKHI